MIIETSESILDIYQIKQTGTFFSIPLIKTEYSKTKQKMPKAVRMFCYESSPKNENDICIRFIYRNNGKFLSRFEKYENESNNRMMLF